jgi:hypothetical protein
MKIAFFQFGRSIACMLVLAAFTTTLLGQKLAGDSTSIKTVKGSVEVVSAPNAAVDPVFFNNQNMNCAGLNALHVNGVGDTRFSHIIEDFELKLDFGTPNGTFPFTTGNGRIVVGPESPNRSVTVSSSGSTVSSWSSQLPITALILKIGNDAFVYPYKPFRLNDTNLITGDQQSISHLTFCFAEPTGPTAGDAAINGRVVDASGNGISKAQLVLINGATGESKITMTNPLGYYTIPGLDVNELYVLNVSHKRYTFTESQRTVMLTDSFTAVDFVAAP